MIDEHSASMDIESNNRLDRAEAAEEAAYYKPVNIDLSNAVGSVFLGIVSIMLVFALLRAQRRIHDLAMQLARYKKQQLRDDELHGRDDAA